MLRLVAAALVLGVATRAAATQIAFDSFIAPQVGQAPGFGFTYGSVGVNPPAMMGDSFVSAASGLVTDVWLPLREEVSNSPANVVTVSLATDVSGTTPDMILGSWTLTDALKGSFPTLPIHIDASGNGIQISQDVRYWLLVTPIAPTTGVGWLAGVDPPTPERRFGYTRYDLSGNFLGWSSAYGGAAPAYRIDVSPVPLPPSFLLLATGLALMAFRFRYAPAHLRH